LPGRLRLGGLKAHSRPNGIIRRRIK